jgi:hypothetical protein
MVEHISNDMDDFASLEAVPFQALSATQKPVQYHESITLWRYRSWDFLSEHNSLRRLGGLFFRNSI